MNNETMIMDLDVLNIHCEKIDSSIELMGIDGTPFKFDDELDRLEFMVKMMFKHSEILKDTRWEIAIA
tara:strand:- start:805 stop:1008 length:204 start_codon:yes stop_codon:yes gene_type:complete